MASILAVDDDVKICIVYQNIIEQLGHQLETAHNLNSAKQLLTENAFDIILLDLDLPDGNGLDLLPELTNINQAPEVIIITGTGDAHGAELAFKYGAWDFVQKPFLISEISLPITRALQYRKEKFEKPAPAPLRRSSIIGNSPQLNTCLQELGKAAATDASVLITGETGTGKELFARALHENSRRAAKPFVVVDCAALPESLLESMLFGHEKGSFTGAERRQVGLLSQADGGTLMLDEVGDLTLSAQKSFLRSLQERRLRPIGGTREIPFDVRVVAATNLDLNRMVSENRFRQDLLYRIRAIEIKLPPLRERLEDIEEIVVKKIHELTRKYAIPPKAISSDFIRVLTKNYWPGNVRELINVLESVLAAVGNDATIIPKHLPAEYRIATMEFDAAPATSKEPLSPEGMQNAPLPTLADYRAKLEKNYLKELLREANGNRKVACDISGVSQSRLYGLLAKHGLPSFTSK